MWEAARLSLLVVLVAAPAMALIGLALAVVLARSRSRWRPLLETVLMLPLVLPPSVVGYLLLRFLGNNGPIEEGFGLELLFTWQAAAIAGAVVGLPLMIQSARIGIQHVDRVVEDAARVDGASTPRLLVDVVLPLARNAILAGIMLATVRALGEFGATLAVAGSIPGRTQTLPLAVYDAMQRGDYALANQIAALMIGIGFVTILMTNRLASSNERGD